MLVFPITLSSLQEIHHFHYFHKIHLHLLCEVFESTGSNQAPFDHLNYKHTDRDALF